MADGFIIRRGGSSSRDSVANSYLPTFTYTGTCRLIDDENGNWRIKFFTSGTLKFTKLASTSVDIFCVGAGGGGNGGGGGGGGYTKTVNAETLTTGTSYTITIGAGGYRATGGTSSFGSLNKAAGGYVAGQAGGNGGSGGGGYYYGGAANTVAGGYDGGNGLSHLTSLIGKGQKEVSGPNGENGTTREFGETTGDLYAGGGAGETYSSTTGLLGGYGGGGRSYGYEKHGDPGTKNTGGGGGARYSTGGTGIVIIRNAR